MQSSQQLEVALLWGNVTPTSRHPVLCSAAGLPLLVGVGTGAPLLSSSFQVLDELAVVGERETATRSQMLCAQLGIPSAHWSRTGAAGDNGSVTGSVRLEHDGYMCDPLPVLLGRRV